MLNKYRLSALTALVIGAVAPITNAQNVVFTNSANAAASNAPYSIPMTAGSSVVVAPDGNLRIQCQTETDGRCVGMPAPGQGGGNPNPPAGAPAVTLSSPVADSDANTPGTQVPVNTSFTINASFTNSPETCVRSASPSVNGWDGAVLPGLVGGSFSLSTQGSTTIKARCFNAAGVGEGTITLIGVAGQVEPPPAGEPTVCAQYRAQHNYQAVGIGPVVNAATNRNVNRDLSTLAGLFDGTIDTTLYFIKTAPNQYIGMAFTGVQLQAALNQSSYSPGGQQHAGQQMAAYAYMTISRCRGDFRLTSDLSSSGDPNLACASSLTTGLSDNMVSFIPGSTHSTPPNFWQACNIDRNATYYLNIVYADPRGGLSSGEQDCSGAGSCGMKFGVQ